MTPAISRPEPTEEPFTRLQTFNQSLRPNIVISSDARVKCNTRSDASANEMDPKLR